MQGRSSWLKADKIRRVVLCSGKVYYDLFEEREKRGSTTSICCASSSSIRSRPRKLALEEELRASQTPSVMWSGARKSREKNMGREERVKMTRLRQTIARRLKDAQNTAAMLTTFNEVDMSEVMACVRVQGRVREEARREARLHGLLREGLRARAEGSARGQRRDRRQDIVYKNYVHIGVAVGTDKGLVVPVVRDADR
jgi:pyruvate/2-oxoglutarate dehydrogenase complex dihydrolipoamide acyltransferase (E2) component